MGGWGGGERGGTERGSALRTIFPERTREGYRRSDERCNYCKGNAGETSHRQDGEMFVFVVCVKMVSSLVSGFERPVSHTGSPQDVKTSLLLK